MTFVRQLNTSNKIKLAVLMAASTLMFGCSGVKNSSETKGIGPGTLNPCSGECVNIEFTNEPLVNVNYTCGTVNNVTGNASQASCPNEQELKFFIQGRTSERKVELGKTSVNAINSKNVNQYLLRKTPLSLVTSKEVTDESSSDITKAINIIRFLDAFRTRNIGTEEIKVPYNKFAPVNRTVIKDKFKNNMDEFLTEDVTVDDFASDAFIEKTKAWLDSHGLKITLSSEQARNKLMSVLKTDFAAVYFQPSLAVSPLLNNVNAGFNQFLLGIGITGNNSGDTEVINMSVYGLSTRDGGNIGHGLYWSAPIEQQTDKQTNSDSIAQQQYRVFYNKQYEKMHKLNPEKTGFNLFNGRADGFVWQINNSRGEVIDFNQGKFVRNFVVLGNEGLKTRYISGDEELDNDVLGKWQQKSSIGSNSVIASGTATISKIPQTAVSSFFDPSVWLGEHVVGQDEGYVFPLHATLEFKYGNGKSACGVGGCDFEKGGKLGITILESGDIITDGSNASDTAYVMGKPDCAATTVNNGIYQAGDFSEKRIGTVRATSQRVGNEIGSFINPSILLAGVEFGELDGLHIGTLALLNNRVTIDVANLVDSAKNLTGSVGSINIYDIGTSNALVAAKWANVYNNFDSIRIQNSNENISSVEVKSLLKSSGQVSIALSDCYQIKKRS